MLDLLMVFLRIIVVDVHIIYYMIIYDFVFNTYLMSREPRNLEFLCTLVDGSHWSGHKKTKKG